MYVQHSMYRVSSSKKQVWRKESGDSGKFERPSDLFPALLDLLRRTCWKCASIITIVFCFLYLHQYVFLYGLQIRFEFEFVVILARTCIYCVLSQWHPQVNVVTGAGGQCQCAGSAFPIQLGREPGAGSVPYLASTAEQCAPNTHRAPSSSTLHYQPAD